jgi:glycosyltransferase involved in cell wall biosynthesis
MKLTLAITTYQRTDMVLEVFEKVYDHPLIDEIVIRDDGSPKEIYDSLVQKIYDKFDWYGRIRIYRNQENLGMSRNKAEVIKDAKNEWVALIDSDNELYPAKENLNPLIIYCPEKAEPDHDFTTLPNRVIDKQNAKDFLRQVEFRVFLNTCNYVVNRDEYLKTYEYDETIKESDTIYFNTRWLSAGNAFYVVPGMRYHHRKWDGSGWLNGDHRYNMNKASELQEKIKNL